MEEVCCDFKYSGVGRAFIACAVAATLGLLAITPMASEARLLACAWVAALALHSARALAHASGLRLDCTRAIAVRSPGGVWRTGTVRGGCFVAPWLTIVRWRPDGAGRDHALVVLPDMLSVEAMRKIRVILKWA